MIKKEDYEEPVCLLLDDDGNPRCKEHINISAVILKLDELYNKERYDEAKKVILYWIEEAKMLGDKRSAFVMYDEGIGLSRKTGDKEWGLECIKNAFTIAENKDLIDPVGAGTAYLNGATTLKAFGKVTEALPYYEKAFEIYNEKIDKNDYRFASLYNNYALALCETGELKKAEKFFKEAIEILNDKFPLEVAVSCTNLSDLYYKQNNLDVCDEYLKRGYEILKNFKGEKDGYYAFICKKCASAYSYHGYFLEEKQLLKWAEEIYSKD